MLEDGIKSAEFDSFLRVKDIAEIVSEHLT